MQRTMFMVLGWGIEGSKSFGPFIAREAAHERAKDLMIEDADRFDHAVVQLIVVDEELYHPAAERHEGSTDRAAIYETTVRDLD
jgi:hypothetical protein